MKNYKYCTYKFYDEKGRRLAIFANENGDHLEAKIYTCSKSDQFHKWMIRNVAEGEVLLFENYAPVEFTPQEVKIPIEDGKPGRSFMEYLHRNFWKPQDVYVVDIRSVLFKNSKPSGIRTISREEVDTVGKFKPYYNKRIKSVVKIPLEYVK